MNIFKELFMKKVYFLIQDKCLPSSRVRCLNLIPFLNKKEFKADWVQIPRGFFTRLRLFYNCKKYDIIFLQKKLFSPFEFIILRIFVKKIIFDFDDAIYLRDVLENTSLHSKEWRSYARKIKFVISCKYSNLVVAGNSYLYNEALKYNKKCKILPSAVPYNDNIFLLKKEDVPVIGWVGIKNNLKHLKLIENALINIAKQTNFVFRVISSEPYNINGVKCEFVNWSINTQEEEIAKFDIGVMPLVDTPFSRGKCSYKILQYMSNGVPFVASAVGMNCELVKKYKKIGYIAYDPEEFEKKLDFLLKNNDERLKMSKNCKFAIKNKFSIERINDSLEHILSMV